MSDDILPEFVPPEMPEFTPSGITAPPAEQYWFSATTLHFYAGSLRDVYEAAGTWQSDCVQISYAIWQTYRAVAPKGKTLGAADGQPAWVDVIPPTLTLRQQATQQLNQTMIDVVCASLPALNDSYPIDLATRHQITDIAASINVGLGLPSGGKTFNWAGANGPHEWPMPQFMALAGAVMRYVYNCTQVAQGHSENLPDQILTIP
jgi:hypothetical protein